MASVSISFTVESCVRGYHIFQHTWIPIHGEVLSCSRERGNRSDPFAVAVKKGEDIVGHVPRRFSCASSLFLQSGGLLACEVTGDRRYSRDLLQGGMEIPCVYTFSGVPDLVHAAVTEVFENDIKPEVVDITDHNRPTDVLSTSKEVWVKIQDITLTLEDKHIVLDGLRLKDQHINSVHRLLKQQFPSINGLRLS